MKEFWKIADPWLYQFIGDASSFTDRLWALGDRRHAVRFVRGARMRDVSSLFDEWAAALQFPYYFGHNWDAFDECIADLGWIDANGYAVAILDAALILPDDRDLVLLFDILERAAQEWRAPTPFRPARPFKVVLHVREDNDGRVGAALARMNREPTRLV